MNLLTSGGSVAELCSALCSAAGEDLAAVCGCHSLAEAVLFLALALLGLISTKHISALLSDLILNIGATAPKQLTMNKLPMLKASEAYYILTALPVSTVFMQFCLF